MRSWALVMVEWSIALVVLGAMSLLAMPAHSQELGDENSAAEAALASQRKELQASCGSSVRVTVDWSSFEFVDSFTPVTAAVYCGEVVRALAHTCAVAPAVSAKVKGVACHFGKPSAGMVDMHTTAGGALDATFDWEGLNLYDDSRTWLDGYAKSGNTASKSTSKKNPKIWLN